METGAWGRAGICHIFKYIMILLEKSLPGMGKAWSELALEESSEHWLMVGQCWGHGQRSRHTFYVARAPFLFWEGEGGSCGGGRSVTLKDLTVILACALASAVLCLQLTHMP